MDAKDEGCSSTPFFGGKEKAGHSAVPGFTQLDGLRPKSHLFELPGRKLEEFGGGVKHAFPGSGDGTQKPG